MHSRLAGFPTTMTASIQFRPIAESDLETLFQIYASTRAQEMAIVPWSEADKERFLRMQFSAQKVHYDKYYADASRQIILIDDQTAGRLYVYRTDNQILIVDITLLPPFRGQGVGTLVIQDLIDEGIATNRPLLIHVEKHNPAKRLYERLNFEVAEDLGIYELMKRAV